jgi:cytochrome c peroxidase
MKKAIVFVIILIALVLAAFRLETNYATWYHQEMLNFKKGQQSLLRLIQSNPVNTPEGIIAVRNALHEKRLELKKVDFWLRYLEPIMHKHVNGPLPVEWETEVFEKFEKPYRRTGGGLSLAEQYLDETNISGDSLQQLIGMSVTAMDTYMADSITVELKNPAHLYYANRLFLLNLASIYTTGFECPDTSRVIHEAKLMLSAVKDIYSNYNASFPSTPLTDAYLKQYDRMVAFTQSQPDGFSQFDRYTFIREYVNPLFSLNQALIRNYKFYSRSFNDYSLDDNAGSIFDKTLYRAQTVKGIFSFVEDSAMLNEINRIGKLLYYDPILSGNNKRSCASCHNPAAYFTDTTKVTPMEFDGRTSLARNAPTLLNAEFNHLLMLDGKELTLQSQARAVISNPIEMNSRHEDVVKKVMDCKEYAAAFNKFLPMTPEETEVGIDHIVSAITLYYSGFSRYYAPFDEAMNRKADADAGTRNGFNLFMGKGQCGTCHFPPHFNGVKPPYVGSEFEVLGVPADTAYTRVSPDSGRYGANPAPEMFMAFRTGSIRNSSFTGPYMHNGVFHSLEQVIDFYDKGGGAGRKLTVDNQTLEAEPLNLTEQEKSDLLIFMKSLDENITFGKAPKTLPSSGNKALNKRKPGGEY